MYNIYFYLIIWFTTLFFIFDKIVDYLNTLNFSDKLPVDAKDIYDEEKYKKSQNYEKTKHKFWLISGTFSFFVSILVLIFWWFWFLDSIVRSYLTNETLISLSFFWVIFILQLIINLPFSYYQTFVIEEKFGFNKMTKKLFFIDLIKSLFLSLIIGWVLLWSIIYIYTLVWANFWIYAWIIISIFSIFIMMFYTTFIVPIFNKLSPLEEWELKNAIKDFWKKVWFSINNIFVIDWSKRSSKANAYFSGFGAKKTIVLYDTLINDLTTDELVAVLAHEIWHYKKKHTLFMLWFSILQTGLILFLFSLIIDNKDIALALNANVSSFHIWWIAFSILFTPLSLLLGILWNIISRKNEYEADNFAKVNYGWWYLITWLKKLSNNNLTNLSPHWFYEFIHYTHPTVLKRINKLKN